MQIKSISFQNYKAFALEQKIELRPITILIGKNSSGKSAVAKLFTALENSLSNKIEEPLLLSNENVVLAGQFRDILYNREPIYLSIRICLLDDSELYVTVFTEKENSPKLLIYDWEFKQYKFRKIKDENLYEDESGKKHSILFKGFLPISITDEEGTSKDIPVTPETFSLNVDYIGPFRILPERVFILSGQLNYENTGIKGENAYYMLGVSKLTNTEMHKLVSKWYENHFDGWKLEVNDKNNPYLELELIKNTTAVNIVDVGQGMNQVLPLVVRANFGKPNSLIVLEQPELHLHPAAHGDLAELFARSAMKHKQSFLVETHSENIILRLRRLIVDNDFDFKHSDIVIYWVDDAEKGQNLKKITISEDGTLSDWPTGVFNENIEEIMELRKALKKKQVNDNRN